jgi:hypothetical protein
MAGSFYYADSFIDSMGMISPAKDEGNGLEEADIPPRYKTLKYDKERTPPRFVIALHPDHDHPAPGWVRVSGVKLLKEYPDLKPILSGQPTTLGG